MVRLTDFLPVERIYAGVQPGERDDVLKSLIDRVGAEEGMSAEKVTTVLRGVLKRERMGSTGIGRGIAIPHAKTSAVDRPIVAFCRLAEPIPYGATDGAPVHSLFLVVSPLEQADEHVGLLKWIARLARSDYYATVMRNTNDPASLHGLFEEFDAAP